MLDFKTSNCNLIAEVEEKFDDRDSRLVQEALSYAELGFKVIPLGKYGKAPYWKRWPKRASTDPNIIVQWLERMPETNIGIMMGENYVAVDIDPRNDGDKSWELFLGKRVLPPTAHARSGSGGQHLLFRVSPSLIIINSKGLWPGIDIKARNGIIVAAPSVHPQTREEYVWLRHPSLGIADIPIWLLEALKTKHVSSGSSRRVSNQPTRMLDVLEIELPPVDLVAKRRPNSPLILNRIGDCKFLIEEAIDRFPVYEFGHRNNEMGRLVGSLLGKGYREGIVLEVVEAWWTHFFNSGTIRTSPEFARAMVTTCIQSTIDNTNFVKAVGIDHKKACEEILLEEWQATLIKDSIVYKELKTNTPTLHTPSKSITVKKRDRFCRSLKERAFVNALVVHFTYKLRILKELPLKATMKQIQEIIETRFGITLKDSEIERLKTRYFTRPDKPATRFELVIQTVSGEPGTPSEFELTGLLQFLPHDSKPGETHSV